ncbi:MAG: aminodeoxychorismate/anthranilate synthase component II [Bacteroidota bacterium]
MRVLLVDNYDSFTYNLAQLIAEAGSKKIDIVKNDALKLAKVADYDKIVFSPGPGVPMEVPVMSEILATYASHKSILGICLGHQAIACFYGAQLINLKHPLHGISSTLQITNENESLFAGLSGNIAIGRYHSWVICEDTLPDCLLVTSQAEDGCIMSIAHRSMDVKGLQFHPESYITHDGKTMMKNWLEW